MIRKRSVTLQAHATSVSLEDQYWDELKRMAAELDVSLSTLIERVDAARGAHNLSSALRLAVLADLKSKIGEADQTSGPSGEASAPRQHRTRLETGQ